MGGFEGAQVAFDRGAGDAEFRGGLGNIELTTALPQNIFEKGGETIHIPEPEKALDVAGEKGIHPLAVEGRFFFIRQQGWRQTTMEQTALESRSKGLQFLQ